MAPVLGYWKIRGLAQPIRFLLAHTGTEFEEKLYECGPAPDYDKSCWFNEKEKLGLDFPNLPYYIDGDVKLTQSSAILRYIARQHNLLGNSEEEKIKVDLLNNQIADYRNNLIHAAYSPNFEDILDNYLKDLQKEIKLVSQFLGKHKFLAGDNVTFVDFTAYEYLVHITLLKADCLDGYDNLKEYRARFEALPKVAQYLKTSETVKYPLNNKMAKFGGGAL